MGWLDTGLNIVTGGGYGVVKGAIEGDPAGAVSSVLDPAGVAGGATDAAGSLAQGDVMGAVGSALDPFGIFSGNGLFGGGESGEAPASEGPAFDMEAYADRIAAAQEHYTDTMRELTEQTIRENKKFATIQLAQTNINQAAMDDYRIAENFVLRNIETGYIEQETRMGVTSAAIPMPFVDGRAVAANAPHVETPEMFDGNSDPLDAREAHMNRMDEIVAQVESGEELSDADKDYLAGLRPPVDWQNVDAIYHEANEAQQAYEAFANARTPEVDLEASQEWYDEFGQHSGELASRYTEAYQNVQWLGEIEKAVMAHPFQPIAVTIEGMSFTDNSDINGQPSTVTATELLEGLGLDPATMTRTEFTAAIEQAETDFQDVMEEQFAYAGPDRPSSQSVSPLGASSVTLNQEDNEDELNEAEALIGGLE